MQNKRSMSIGTAGTSNGNSETCQAGYQRQSETGLGAAMENSLARHERR